MQSTIRSSVLALCLLACGGAARAEITNCTEITAVPYFITAPGIYCLKQSLALQLVQGVAIQVQVDDVTIDLNGHTLANFPGSTTGWGIVGRNLKRVTVRNGTLRAFEIGVYLENLSGNAMGHLMEDLVVERSKLAGLVVEGRHSVIRNNRIMETGSASFTYGIFASGSGIHVAGNVVSGIVEAAGGEAAAITAYQANGAVVERNVVSSPAFGPNKSTGIVVQHGRVTVVGNRVTSMRTGIHTPAGVTGLYVDNSVGGATTAFSGGIQAGATNFSF